MCSQRSVVAVILAAIATCAGLNSASACTVRAPDPDRQGQHDGKTFHPIKCRWVNDDEVPKHLTKPTWAGAYSLDRKNLLAAMPGRLQQLDAAYLANARSLISAMSDSFRSDKDGLEVVIKWSDFSQKASTSDEERNRGPEASVAQEARTGAPSKVVWKTPGPVKAQPWSPFTVGSDKKDEPES